MSSYPAQFKYGAELEAPGDEYNKSPCRKGNPRLLKEKTQPPTLPLYYEGKMMKTIFPQNYVYVLRTTTTRYMVSSIDFYFHFLANFQA